MVVCSLLHCFCTGACFCWCSTAVSGLAAAMDKADAEVTRLKEWQDVFKRMADDRAQEAAQELQAFKKHAAERQVAAAGATRHERKLLYILRY